MDVFESIEMKVKGEQRQLDKGVENQFCDLPRSMGAKAKTKL